MIDRQFQTRSDRELLAPYLDESVALTLGEDGILVAPIGHWTRGMQANRDFFNHPAWAAHYFAVEHRDQALYDRYDAAIASLAGQVVVDVGCGPGNWFKLMGGQPKIVIGVDLSTHALAVARSVGYTPLLADAHTLPLRDGCADIVVANATLHHCDDMARILAETARLLRPGGLLVTDLDPQITAWQLRGAGLWLHRSRKLSSLVPGLRSLLGRSAISWAQQVARVQTEVHNRLPGDGIELGLYRQVLEPMGFAVQVFPHNHTVGAAVLDGEWGRAPRLIRWAQWLSGMNPDRRESAQSVMCVARRVNA
jgi:SAM-dependent methyltransferase